MSEDQLNRYSQMEDNMNDTSVATSEDTNNELTINELKFLVTLIREMSARGAFRPEEFIDVGTINRRLLQLIEDNVR